MSNSPIIANLELISPGKGIETLAFLIADVTQFLNVGKTMNSAQVLATAKLLVEDVETKNLKPDDYKICFDNAKKGIYGKTFDRVDGQIIFEWLRIYMSDRMNECENLNITLHKKKKPDNLIPEGLKEMYRELAKLRGDKYDNTVSAIENIITENFTAPALPERKKPIKSQRDIKIQDLFKEFDTLNHEEIRGKKFVRLDNQILDNVEYVDFKIKLYDKETIAQKKKISEQVKKLYYAFGKKPFTLKEAEGLGISKEDLQNIKFFNAIKIEDSNKYKITQLI